MFLANVMNVVLFVVRRSTSSGLSTLSNTTSIDRSTPAQRDEYLLQPHVSPRIVPLQSLKHLMPSDSTTVIMISRIMLNLRTHSRRRGVMHSGKLAKTMLGMRSSLMSSTTESQLAGVTTIMAIPVSPTTSHPHGERARSMFTETLERFGAPMTENEDYEEIMDLPIYSLADPHRPPGPDQQWVLPVALAPFRPLPAIPKG
jgi:hypothetical protein